MSEKIKIKRPASHRWIIGISAFMTIGLAAFLSNIITGRAGGTFRQYWLILAVFSGFTLALFSLLLGRRKRWAYYLVSALLAVWASRGVETSLVYIGYSLSKTPPPDTPYFHALETDRPFVVQHRISGVQQITMFVGSALMVWLFIRFTLGRPSRSYYQFGDAESKGVEPSLGSPTTIPDDQKIG